MNQRQIELVKATWMIFQKIDPLLVGDVLYDKLFSDHPSLRNMFTTEKETQSRKMIAMLDFIVNRIDNISQLREDIKNLSMRHQRYGVKPDHYHSVEVALLWMLRQGLGSDWNDEVEQAWAACYRAIAKVMSETSGAE